VWWWRCVLGKAKGKIDHYTGIVIDPLPLGDLFLAFFPRRGLPHLLYEIQVARMNLVSLYWKRRNIRNIRATRDMRYGFLASRSFTSCYQRNSFCFFMRRGLLPFQVQGPGDRPCYLPWLEFWWSCVISASGFLFQFQNGFPPFDADLSPLKWRQDR
jgi:hypothetical protein